MRCELEDLAKIDDFSAWNADRFTRGLDVNAESLEPLLEEHCPTFLFFLDKLTRPQRQLKNNKQRTRPVRRFLSIIVNLLFTRHVKTCNNMPMQLGLQLHAHGSKRRIIDVCHDIGISTSYETVLTAVKKLQGTQQDEMKNVATTSGGWVIVWDNFEHTVGVKDQATDHRAAFHSITSAKLIEPAWWPDSGLRQTMFRPSSRLFWHEILLHPHVRLDTIQQEVLVFAPF